MFLNMVGSAHETKSELFFSNPTVQTFSCQIKDSLERMEFDIPQGLAEHCGMRAEKSASGTISNIVVGAIVTILGGLVYFGYAYAFMYGFDRYRCNRVWGCSKCDRGGSNHADLYLPPIRMAVHL